MFDLLVGASAPEAGITVAAAITTDILRETRDRHDLAPTASAAVGRLLTGAILFGIGLRRNERVTLQITGTGPIGGLSADTWLLDESTLGARGYAKRPNADLPANARGKFDVSALIGQGTLQVTKSYPQGRPYMGVVALESGEIAEDLVAYLRNSEQIPSVVALGVLAGPEGIKAAGGIIAQVLPGADEKAIALLEARATAMPSVTRSIIDGADAHALIHALAGSLELRSHRTLSLRFACTCNQARVETTLLGMGHDELLGMAQERHETEVVCEFCKRPYLFTREDMQALIDRGNLGESV